VRLSERALAEGFVSPPLSFNRTDDVSHV